MKDILIKAKNLTIRYPKSKIAILQDLCFEIENGRTIIFMGKSGSGKTTLLYSLAQVLFEYEGTLEYSVMSSEKPIRVDFVSQTTDFIAHMNLLENCIHPQRYFLNLSRKEAEERASQTLHTLDLFSIKELKPNSLTLAQKHRLAVARALLLDTKVLLFDEPTSALDPLTTCELKTLLENLQTKGITLVISTHDMSFVKGNLDKIYLINEGRIIDSFDSKIEELSHESCIYKYIYGKKESIHR